MTLIVEHRKPIWVVHMEYSLVSEDPVCQSSEPLEKVEL